MLTGLALIVIGSCAVATTVPALHRFAAAIVHLRCVNKSVTHRFRCWSLGLVGTEYAKCIDKL